MWAKILKMISELRAGRAPSEASISSTSSFSESTKERLASDNEYAFEEDGHRIEQPHREAPPNVDRINSQSLSEASKQHSKIVNHRSVVAEKVAEAARRRNSIEKAVRLSEMARAERMAEEASRKHRSMVDSGSSGERGPDEVEGERYRHIYRDVALHCSAKAERKINQSKVRQECEGERQRRMSIETPKPVPQTLLNSIRSLKSL